MSQKERLVLRDIESVEHSRVVLLTNILPPYLLPVFQAVAHRIASLRILLSVPMESDRPWQARWDGLNVTVQKSVSMSLQQKHPQGFASQVDRHFPYDTLPLLLSFRPDVLISAQLGFRTIQSALYRLLSPRSRLVIWVDGSEHTERAYGPTRTFFRRVLLRCADAVLVIGESGERYIRRLGVPSARIVQVPFVTQMSPFQAMPLQRNKDAERRLLYVGRLVEGKGLVPFVKELVRWIEQHPCEQRELWFVGDGPLRRELQDIRTTAGLSLRFFGNVSYDELPAFYAQAGVCVLPTLADTWGLVVNEALAAGVPVLGSLYSQAVEQLVRDGENGWTYFPDKPGDAPRIFDRALSIRGEVLARMRHEARASVAHLTPEHAARHFLQAIALAQSTLPGMPLHSTQSIAGKP